MTDTRKNHFLAMSNDNNNDKSLIDNDALMRWAMAVSWHCDGALHQG